MLNWKGGKCKSFSILVSLTAFCLCCFLCAQGSRYYLYSSFYDEFTVVAFDCPIQSRQHISLWLFKESIQLCRHKVWMNCAWFCTQQVVHINDPVLIPVLWRLRKFSPSAKGKWESSRKQQHEFVTWVGHLTVVHSYCAGAVAKLFAMMLSMNLNFKKLTQFNKEPFCYETEQFW